MTEEIKATLIETLPKDLCIDLDDRVRAEATKAFEMVRDHAGLDKRRGRALEGQARFRMMEKGFQEVCETHGALILENGIIPGSDLKVFQPFMRFGRSGKGVILGLAAISEPKTLPTKNKSRLAGVSLNYDITPRLDFDGLGPKVGDIFALFLVARDRTKGGKIEEIAMGVVDSEYESFLYSEELSSFMSGYVHAGKTPESGADVVTSNTKSGVSLKKEVRAFVPPEYKAENKKTDEK